MTIRWVSITVLLAGLGFVGNRGSTAPARVCSIAPFVGGRDASATFFLGRAQPRTVIAGPGTIRSASTEGHWGLADSSKAIAGQAILVDRLAGKAASRLESAFARNGDREVVVVPWDYDPGCRPVPWTRSGLWVTTGEAGFYRVRLRPDSLWIDGRPVFDATLGDLEPYPHGVFFQRGFRGTDALRRGPSLTPAEYFDLYALLPAWGESSHDSSAAATRLDAWERSHPETARKYPAPEILKHARSLLNRR